MADEHKIDFSTVLASSVHDMKNSVSMLISSVETILEEYKPQGKEASHHFKTLHYEASRINGELIQLLTMYRMDNGFLPVHVDEYFISDVIEDQVARNQVLVDTSGISISVDCDEDQAWYFDTDLIGGVLHNILVNCIRYTKDRIHIAVKEEGSRVLISIEDNGPGYPEDMLKNPAQRVLDAKLSQGATHLGLFFAEQIAELHSQDGKKGKISLSNGGRYGGGVFELSLP